MFNQNKEDIYGFRRERNWFVVSEEQPSRCIQMERPEHIKGALCHGLDSGKKSVRKISDSRRDFQMPCG